MADSHLVDHNRAPWRDKWSEVIFGHDTASGRLFDVVLLTVILLSVLSVLLESVRSIREAHGSIFALRNGSSPRCLRSNMWLDPFLPRMPNAMPEVFSAL